MVHVSLSKDDTWTKTGNFSENGYDLYTTENQYFNLSTLI